MTAGDRMRQPVLMRLGQAFLRIVDPASAYMQSQGPGRRRGPVFRGAAVFGPGVEGGARQATPEELEEIRARHELGKAEDERRHTSGDIDPDALHDAVRDLVRHRETTLRRGSTKLTARLVTFWHGDAILDIRVAGPGPGASHLSRVSRQRRAEDEQVFAEYIRHVLKTT
jgi:hypothetical protein